MTKNCSDPVLGRNLGQNKVINERKAGVAVKVAVATNGGQVSPHFGHCEEFTIFEIAGGKITSRKTVSNPGHAPGFLPEFLAGLGVTHVIAGGMGARAVQLLEARGIAPLLGVEGAVDKAVEDLLNGVLKTGESLCTHGEGHGHGHGHGTCGHGHGGCH